MSPIPRLPAATAPPPQKATEARTELRKGDSPQKESDGSFTAVLSKALPKEKPSADTQIAAEGEVEQDVAVVATAQSADSEVKHARASFLAQVESVDVGAGLSAPAPNEEVAEADGPSPETTAREPELALAEEAQQATQPQTVIADLPRDEQASAPVAAHPELATTEVVEDGERVVPHAAPPVAVERPTVPIANDTKQPGAIPAEGTPDRSQPAGPKAAEAPKVAALRLNTGREGQLPVAVEGDPVVQLVTRIDGDAEVVDGGQPVMELSKRPAAKPADVPIIAERVLTKQVPRTIDGETTVTRDAAAANKTESTAKPFSEPQSAVLGQGDEAEADNDGESQRGSRQQTEPDRVANAAVPTGAIEKTVAGPVSAKPKPARTTMTPAPVASVPVQAVADVASRPVVPMSQPSTAAAPPSAPLAEEPALNAQLQQQASRTTLNVVMHDDRMGRVALQLIERGGWVETVIRTSDPRGAQVLSNATSGLIETLQQRGVTAMAAGGSAAWDAQEGQRRDNPHRDQDPQRRRLRVRRQGQEFIGALAQAAS